jgi:hypothetical protein
MPGSIDFLVRSASRYFFDTDHLGYRTHCHLP